MDSKKNIGLYIVIVILVVVVSFFVYDKIVNDKEPETSYVNNTNNNDNSDDIEKDNFVFKLDNSKEWIYDAEYEKNVSASYYETYYDEIYYAKDIVVPFINVDSAYVKKSNNEIKEVFNDAIANYNMGVNDKTTYVEECNYQKYIKNNILSVILTYGVGATDVVLPEHYVYNVNLNSGDKLTYQEIYKSVGFNSGNIDFKVENAITSILQKELKDLKDPTNDTGDGGYYPDGTNFDTYNNESINNYRKSISNNTLKYFISEDGKLNVIVKLSIPVGVGEFDTIITVN